MAAAPEHHRAARLATPHLPLPAILGFVVLGAVGSAFLAYTSFSHGEAHHSVAVSNDAPVYEARAVPFDSQREEPAQRAASIARALSATQTEVHRSESLEAEKSAPTSSGPFLTETDRGLRGFNRSSNAGITNSFLSFTATSFGISAQSLPSGFAAPDAETLTSAPVPEASTWMCGGALLVLVAFRGARASWHRKRRRIER